MRVAVIGLGVQGVKRKRFAGADCIATVDPVNPDATYRPIGEVDPASYDAALLCVPDGPKQALIDYCIAQRKHVLVEKPLAAAGEASLSAMEASAREAGVVIYVAYNHRFEPHFMAMRDLIAGGSLGRIYRCRMFYGNGTARLVRESAWRDRGAGVLPDLGSHLFDTARFWFGDICEKFRVVCADRFENLAPDHVVVTSEAAEPRIELEMTLLSWRNHFTCDVYAEHGSAHIESLCKWGPPSLTVRRRVLPAGRPAEQRVTLVEDDPTWATEYAHFTAMVADGAPTDLSGDRWLHRVLGGLAREVPAS